MNTQTHDFKERLAWSKQASHEAFWIAAYNKAFPDMIGQMFAEGNTLAQHLGIDRYIHLNNGAVLRVDEKKREKDYNDILLEYVSNDVRKTPGWMDRALQIDYLAYAFMPSKRVYLFPWMMLRRCWIHYRTAWLKQYRTVTAANAGYHTLSVAVPIPVLQRAVQTAAIIQLSDQEIARAVQQPVRRVTSLEKRNVDTLIAYIVGELGGEVEHDPAVPSG